MMKNEDLMKLYKEENTVLKAEIFPINILLIFLAFITTAFAQVPLNGFCRFREFQTNPGFEKLLPVDFNRDGFRDVVLYNPVNKKYSALTFESKSKKFRNTEKYSSVAFTTFNNFDEYSKNDKKYLFASRKDRTAGLLSFSGSGSILFSSRHKFNSYPQNIDASDIEKDGRKELLVSGPSFAGLSILKEFKGVLKENNFGGYRSFSFSSFVDLDYDSYDDIAAFNLNENSIKLFFNDCTSGFSEQRSIALEGKISSFRVMDVNLDRFNDFVLLKNNNLEIMLGDSVSTFQKRFKINSPLPVDEYSMFDFNGDGYNDFALLNIETGKLSIAFAENAVSFFKPVIYFQRKGIVDLASYVDRGGRKLVVLDKNGKIYLIDKFTDFNEDTMLAAGISPKLVGTFDYMNDRAPDYFMVDGLEQQLKLFISARKNLFDRFYSLQLSSDHSNIVVDDSYPDQKVFYCYTKGSRLIEIIRYDFSDGNFKRRILYADEPVDNLSLSDNKTRESKTISLLLNDNGKLWSQSIEYRDVRYLRSGTESISVNVEASTFSSNANEEVFFFTKYGSTLYLNKTSLRSSADESINISSFKLNNLNKATAELAYFRGKSLDDDKLLSLVIDDKNTTLSISKRGSINTIQIENFSSTAGLMKYYSANNSNNLFLYDRNSGKLKKIIWGNIFSDYTVTDIFESKTLNSYIVAPINSKKEILIYSDNNNNLLNFRTIQ